MDSQRIQHIGRVITMSTILLALVALFVLCVNEVFGVIEYLNQQGMTANVRNTVQGMGWRGVVALVLLQTFFMLCVVIPSAPVQLFVGYIYPPYIAVPICVLGTALGCIFLFVTFRLVGERLAHRVSHSSHKGAIPLLLSSLNSRSSNILLLTALLFVVPIIPYGLVSSLLVRSRIRTWQFSLVCLFGCPVASIFYTIVGNNIGNGQWITFGIIVGILIVATIILAINKDKVLAKMVQFATKDVDSSNEHDDNDMSNTDEQ